MERVATDTGKRSAGRPPRVTRDQVVEAACAIGLESVDMGSVARKLGVGVATLYGHVDSREHLVGLAAKKLAARHGISDVGQDWQEAIREHARRSFAVYRQNPRLIVELMDGSLGDLADSEHSDALLAILIARGLPPREALAFFLETNQIVIGAAVGATYLDRVASADGDLRAKSVARGFRALVACLDATDVSATAGDYAPGLERLIAVQDRRMAA